MIPESSLPNTSFVISSYPSRTYRIDTEQMEIRGYVDNLNAVKQAVDKIVGTERYDWLIYSFNYGIELKTFFGKQMTEIIPRIQENIREALLQDDRITDVFDFRFKKNKGALHVTFTVQSTEGDFEKEVDIGV